MVCCVNLTVGGKRGSRIGVEEEEIVEEGVLEVGFGEGLDKTLDVGFRIWELMKLGYLAPVLRSKLGKELLVGACVDGVDG